MQKPWQADKGKQSKQKRNSDGQIALGNKRAAHAGILLCADIFCREDAEACRTAEGKLQKEEGQGEGIVYPRNLLRKQHLPANHRIGEDIDLLQKIRQHNRCRIL